MRAFDAVLELFRSNGKKVDRAVARVATIEHQHRIRLPEDSSKTEDYYLFLGKYALAHPEASTQEAHDQCMEQHPEYWPRTGPKYALSR